MRSVWPNPLPESRITRESAWPSMSRQATEIVHGSRCEESFQRKQVRLSRQRSMRCSVRLNERSVRRRYECSRRLSSRESSDTTGSAERNDFWIAAVCLQHSVPLLSNDKSFDEIDGLQVMHS